MRAKQLRGVLAGIGALLLILAMTAGTLYAYHGLTPKQQREVSTVTNENPPPNP